MVQSQRESTKNTGPGPEKGGIMEYRHEWKHEISRTDLIVLRRRLRAVMAPDEHAVNGCYRVRSLYFDTPEDRALREKLDGVGRREKFRLRLYNGDAGMIRLEQKIRCGSLGSKESAAVTAEEVRALLAGVEIGRGCGRTKKAAEAACAYQAILKLKENVCI